MVLADQVNSSPEDIGANLTPDEIKDSLGSLPGWDLVDGHHLHKAWTFQDFSSALDWVGHAGAICEKQGHHADFKLGWGYAEAITYTHQSEGLTRADITLATELDSIEGPDMS
ncbi:4a-hydroxytetrahydrobiopterin dehydratase [Aphanothece minutissima]|uniref:4a-hydroxytetrahydrobiopterin dehydratase n=1 Tax=Aphanothece cf. minutissima CCALA 015 TaxID=2107695 RepID=A0ABX5FCB5_9CHRO|nr:4a-hydroxytetrahydrobiopterin dehydratase [Aphanothece minutissima]PSB39565.1 pterin-4-alpha-carbinolamine dehydratase [Aphanothece cf. minutissima CCALA 015]